MRGLLVRVAADQSKGGGSWNGPADSSNHEFVYAAIPESVPVRSGTRKPYAALRQPLNRFGLDLPSHLKKGHMHLDPDFDHLTYGDGGERAKQIHAKIGSGDLLVFYSGMRDVQPPGVLVYALIGLYVVDEIIPVHSVEPDRMHENAHTRRANLRHGEIVVRARRRLSGRLKQYIPIGDYRERAYRVWPKLLKEWGGLTVKNGYLQRSARLPEFSQADRFYDWFQAQNVPLLSRNN
jgi:hypothetical protein